MRRLVLLLTAVLATACDTSTGPDLGGPHPWLEVLSVAWEHDDGSRYATGRVRNNADVAYAFVSVDIGLYDAADNVVGSTVAVVRNLGPGEVWEFRAIIVEDEASSFRVTDVEGVLE